MLKALFLALNIRPDEEKQVLLLLGKGFFMGVFIATYKIAAETIFLNELGDVLLREAIFVSGILGVATTALFAYFQNKLSFANLAINNLGIIALFSLGIYFALNEASQEIFDAVVFLMFVMTTPITAVLLLGFWGVFGRLFDLRQSKRIINRIDTGQLLAATIAFLSIPLLSEVVVNTESFLVLGACSLVVSLLFLFRITRTYNLEAFSVEKQHSESKETRITQLAKNKYVLLLSGFLCISMISFTFVDYSFKEAVQNQYPDQSNLRNFLAIFNSAVLILSFILQTFVNNRIVSDYGLKVPLLILPVVMAAFTLAAILADSLITGPIVQGAPYSRLPLFFLFIVLSKLFNVALREAMENPVYKLFFMPLETNIRFDVQAKVEGVIHESARLIGGMLILVLPALAFFEAIHYSYAIILMSIVYLVIAGKLYNNYRLKIQQKLENKKENNSPQETKGESFARQLMDKMSDKKFGTVVFAFRLLDKIQPKDTYRAVNALTKHSDESIRNYAQESINELKGVSVSDNYVISYTGQQSPGRAKKIVPHKDLVEVLKNGNISKRRIIKLCKSEDIQDRQYAAELIAQNDSTSDTSLLIELINDSSPKVRQSATMAAEKKHNPEILQALANNLGKQAYGNMVANTLVTIGDKCLPILENAFYRSELNISVILRIIDIMGRIGGTTASGMLWNKIDYPDRIVVRGILPALAKCGFEADEKQVSRIKYAIDTDVANIAWIMAAYNEIEPNKFGREVRKAVEEEFNRGIENIYMLLAMIYDPQSIKLVKENINTGLTENITYTVEMLDVFLSEDLKQKIIPLLDDLSYSEKAKRLEAFYPRYRLEGQQVLQQLLNRSINHSNRWTKACTLFQIGMLKLERFEKDLIAQLFNVDALLRETAAWALQQINPEAYEKNIVRIADSHRKALETALFSVHGEKALMVSKVLFLRQMPIFQAISYRALAELTNWLKEVVLDEGEAIANNTFEHNYFYMVYQGTLTYWHGEVLKEEFLQFDFIGEIYCSLSHGHTWKLVAREETVLLKIEKEQFYTILADNVEFAKKVVNYM